ncbi:MAG: hypothetical protein FWD42_07080, partial [Solirubrobacterales bacterium]|nr:hypothetical protein [Solirubrobacterales bacterium]
MTRAASVVAALLAAIALEMPMPAPARAVINGASVLDGPTNNILGVNGAAMARDGSGGVVYRKDIEGVDHVFAIPFAAGRWGQPLEVDREDSYGASQPAIAAGEGGRLLVVWVQPRNVSPGGVTEYELMSAALQPGTSAFGQPIIVDPNVGEPNSGDIRAVDPALAMAPDGVAYIVYRVIGDDCSDLVEGDLPNSICPPAGISTDKVVDVRVARFNFLLWSSVGNVNRAPQVAMRNPTPENAPAIGIALDGDGVVAWQEPETSRGAARIWVRRLFGTAQGNVLQASPAEIGGRPVTSDAEAPALAVSPFGEARVAFRIQGATGSAVPVTQLFMNSLLGEQAPSQLLGAVPVGTPQGGLGAPSVAVGQKEGFRMSWSQGGSVRELSGEQQQPGKEAAIGATAGAAPTTINPAGGGTTAWASAPGAPAGVQVRQDYPQGGFQRAQLAGSIPGAISGLALAGDNQGDALVAFAQGPTGDSEVLGAFVQAPPAAFAVTTPSGWVRGGRAHVSWEGAFDAVEGVTYSVLVDGRARQSGLSTLSAHLNAAGLGDGVHHVQVLATDS